MLLHVLLYKIKGDIIRKKYSSKGKKNRGRYTEEKNVSDILEGEYFEENTLSKAKEEK